MQTIDSKLTKIATAATAAGLTADQARHLIHATGGSPRRAKRLLRNDPALAIAMADAFAAAIESGTPFATALRNAQQEWAKQHGGPDETGDDEGKGDDEPDDDEGGVDVARATKALKALSVKPPKAKPDATGLKALLAA